MGTLFNQEPRYKSIIDCAKMVKWVLGDVMGIDPDKATAAQWTAAAAVLTAGLRYQDADAFDEQLAGFGEILQAGFSEIANAMRGCDANGTFEDNRLENLGAMVADGLATLVSALRERGVNGVVRSSPAG